MTVETASRSAAPTRTRPASSRTAPTVAARPLRGATAIIAIAIASSIYGQRFVVPGLRVSVGFLILAVLMIVAIAINAGRIQVGRAVVVVALAGAASALALVASLHTPFAPTLESLLLLIVAWVPFAVLARGRAPWTPVRWDVVLFWVALPAAVAVLAQFALQFTPAGFLDPIMDLSPDIRLTQEEYSISYEFVYGSGLQKPNGFFFAEPSLAAQFMALGAFAALRYKPLWAIVFGAAVALTASGTGTIALAIGIPFAIFTATPVVRIVLVVATAVAVPTVLSLPLIGDAFLGRGAAVANADDGSSNARFVDPFDVVNWAVRHHPGMVWTGFGPGTADQASVAAGFPYANPSFIAKAILEYGAPFGLTLTLVVGFAIFAARGVSLTNRVVLAAMIFFLSGALIQGPTALLLWSALFAAPSRRDQFDQRDLVPRRDPAVRTDTDLWLARTFETAPARSRGGRAVSR